MDLQRLNIRDRRVIAAAATGVVALVVVVAVVAMDGDSDQDASPDGETSIQSVDTTVGAPTTGSNGASTTTSGSSITSASPSTTGSPALTIAATTTTVTSAAATTPPPTAAVATTAPPTSMVGVPVGTVEVREPIPSNETGDFGTGLLVEVTAIEAVDATASQPGEIAGPAVAVELRAINDSDTAIDMLRMQVEVTYGPDRSPGNSLIDGSAPFEGVLEPGAEAIGRYVFGVPLDQRDVIQISVFYDVDAPIVVFEGPGPRA